MKRFPICALLAAALSGCVGSSAAPAPAAIAAAPLAGSHWALVAFESSDRAQAPTAPPPGRSYTLDFGTDGSLGGQFDCNRARGTYTASGTALTIGPLALTRAMCPPGDLGTKLAADLSDVASFTVRGGHLFLALRAGAGTYEFAPFGP